MIAKRANTAAFKRILAFVRGEQNYAHAGEAKAIQRVFKDLPKIKTQPVLDVGCGLGGTAAYVQSHGWGKVTGVDIEEKTIDIASSSYPNIRFVTADVLAIPKVLAEKFALIYAFNVFYIVKPLQASFNALYQAAQKETYFAIFDYIDRNDYRHHRPKYDLLPYPLIMNDVCSKLKKAHWQIDHIVDLDREYEKWYYTFIQNVLSLKEEIIRHFGTQNYNYLYQAYLGLLQSIQSSRLGGAIIYAKPA